MTEHNNHTQLSDSRIKKSIIHTPVVFSRLLMKSVRLLVKRLHRQHLITAGKDQCLSRICTTIFSPFLSLSQFASCRGCSSLFVIESGRVWQIYGLSSGKFGTTQGTARYTDCFPLLPLFLQRIQNEKICTRFMAICNWIDGVSLADVWYHFFYFCHFLELFDTCWHIISFFCFSCLWDCQVAYFAS